MRGRDPVALTSFPGSGNTWVRGLLEKATGVCTGTVYCDSRLKAAGFVGESITDGSVIAVKTHSAQPWWKDTKTGKGYGSAILIVRNSYDALVAERHRRKKNHVGKASSAQFGKLLHAYIATPLPSCQDTLPVPDQRQLKSYQRKEIVSKIIRIMMHDNCKAHRLKCPQHQPKNTLKGIKLVHNYHHE